MRGRFVALTLLWGASFLFIKMGLAGFAPLQVAWGRMFCGALTLLGLALARRERLPRGVAVWARLAVAASLSNVLPFTLFALAQRHTSTALASIGNATTPLFTLLFALVFLPDERPTWARSLGLGIGFGGVLVVLGVWRGAAQMRDLGGMLLILLATASYGMANIWVRRQLSHTVYSSLALATGQLIAGTVELGLFLPATTLPARWLPSALAAVLLLGVFGTGAAYVLMYGLIRLAGATVSSMVTYFIPLVSIAIGVVGLGERLSWNAPLGAAIIIGGAWLSRLTPAPPLAPQPARS